MANASSSYISTFQDEDTVRRTEIFLWSIMAVAVLDLMLLLWTFQPWAKPEAQTLPVAASAEVAMISVGDKPSPFGPVAPRGATRRVTATVTQAK